MNGAAAAALVMLFVVGASVLALVAVNGRAESPVPEPAATPAAVDPSVAAASMESAVLVDVEGCRLDSHGMGVVVDRGLVVTNAHVVAGGSAVAVQGLSGDPHDAIVVAFDPRRDLALLEVPTLELPPLLVGTPRSDTLAVVAARADNGGGDGIELMDSAILRTINIFISDIYGDGRFARRGVELAVDIGPGDSGSAVIDTAGELVGIVFSDSRGQNDVAYAVSSTELGSFIESRAETAVDNGVCRP